MKTYDLYLTKSLTYPGYSFNCVMLMADDPTHAEKKFMFEFGDIARRMGSEVKGIVEVDVDLEQDPAVPPEPFRPHAHSRPSPRRK